MNNSKMSFMAGYESVKNGKITRALSNRDIEEKYPHHVTAAFEQGMIDALERDNWRYKRAKNNIDGCYAIRGRYDRI